MSDSPGLSGSAARDSGTSAETARQQGQRGDRRRRRCEHFGGSVMRQLMRGVAAAVLGTVTVLALTLPASAQVVDPSPSPAVTSQPAAGADKPVDPQFACTQTA